MWKTIKSQTLVDEYHVSVRDDTVELPNGAVIEDFYIVTIPDAAMVAALTEDNWILLKKEFRYACGEDVIECPAGMIENEEDPLDAAKRELLEETGYRSEEWVCLGSTWESTSKLTNHMHLFLAKNVVKYSSQLLDANELLEVISVPLSQAVEMVMSGAINANSSAHLILKVDRMIYGE